MNDQGAQVSAVAIPDTVTKQTIQNKRQKAIEDASVCLAKLRAPGGCDIHCVTVLRQCIDEGISYESVGTTYDEIEGIRINICLAHARQWLTLIREERKRNRKVNDMVNLMKTWLIRGNLSYNQIWANNEEAEFFGELSPPDKAS